jgi:hypothetical protein
MDLVGGIFMVYQQNPRFDPRNMASRRGGDPQRGAQRTLAGLRSVGYDAGSAKLSPRMSQSAPPVMEPVPFEAGAWKNFGEGALMQLKREQGGADPQKKEQPYTWLHLADHVGIHPLILLAFNPEQSGAVDRVLPRSVIIFIPTAGEVIFLQLAEKRRIPVSAQEIRDFPQDVAHTSPELVSEFRRQKESGRVGIVTAARERAAGKTGKAYGYDAGRFYTRNIRLQRDRGKAEVDGHAERIIAWGPSFKCNVYVNDTLDHAGLDTPVNGNGHYATAGQMFERHTAKKGERVRERHLFEEISLADLQPGDIFVSYGGGEANASHTEVITGVVDKHSFFAIGAHADRSYERHYYTDQAAYDARVGELKLNERLRYAAEQIPEEPSLYRIAERHHIRHLKLDGYHFLRHRSVQVGG